MPVIGITGGIATGKSLVAASFRKQGAVVFSADEAAREVVRPGSLALQQIADAFGPGFLHPDGSLDRAALGRLIFASPEARHRLDQITHPPILERLRSQIQEAQAQPPALSSLSTHAIRTLIAVETPLLYEAGMENWFDHIVVVAVPEATQIARLCQRDRCSPEEARLRIAAQMPLAEKLARADYVLWNNEASDAVLRQEAVDREVKGLLDRWLNDAPDAGA